MCRVRVVCSLPRRHEQRFHTQQGRRGKGCDAQTGTHLTARRTLPFVFVHGTRTRSYNHFRNRKAGATPNCLLVAEFRYFWCPDKVQILADVQGHTYVLDLLAEIMCEITFDRHARVGRFFHISFCVVAWFSCGLPATCYRHGASCCEAHPIGDNTSYPRTPNNEHKFPTINHAGTQARTQVRQIIFASD